MKEIVLVNYGGPQKEKEVGRYLYNIFADPNVFKLPGGRAMQRFFASAISKLRSLKVLKKYSIIGFSPLNNITRQLINKLNNKKKNKYYMGMAYCEPYIGDTIAMIKANDIYIFPMFPHYSGTTTGACLDKIDPDLKNIFYIKSFWDSEILNKHIVLKIRRFLNNKSKTAILFSAHSIPLKYVKKGDPYLTQVHKHFELLKQMLNYRDVFLGFQSKIGPFKWAGPTIKDLLDTIQSSGYERVVVYPLSFLIDNFEIKYDLDYYYRDYCQNVPELEYELAECFNDSKEMIEIVETIVSEGEWLRLES